MKHSPHSSVEPITDHASPDDGRPSKVVQFPVHRTEEHFRSFSSGTTDWSWEIDAEGRVLHVSDEVLGVLGYTSAEMLGHKHYEYIIPEDVPRISDIFEKVSHAKAPFGFLEQTMVHRDGHLVYMESLGMPVLGPDGRLRGYRGLCRDITKHKHDQNTLRENERLLREAQRIASLGHYTFCTTKDLWTSSEELDVLLGIGPEFRRNIEGWLKLVHPEDREAMQRYLLEHVVRDRNCFDREYRIVRASDGQTRWVHGRGRLEDDPATGSLLMIGTIQDVTERKSTELALALSEKRLRLVTESTTEGVWDWNTVTNKVYFSDTCAKMLGYSPGEIPDEFGAWYALILDDERASFSARVAECLDGRAENYLGEFRARAKDGRLRWIRICGKVVAAEENGRTTRMVGTMSDVGERRQLEDQLRQAQKLEAVGQLAGGVAHDFNNILAAMTLQLDLMYCDIRDSARTSEGVTELRKAVQRAAGLTRQLLLFSRRTAPETQPIDLNDVVVELLKMLSRLIGENVELRLEAGSALPLIEADVGMAEQVLMNLVVNARDAMPKGGRLTIRTDKIEISANETTQSASRRPGKYVRLIVEDTGSGMSAEVRKRIFEPFFTTKEVGRGTGLGLATIHGIVAQHHGWIEVESEEWKGSRFTVFWPAITAEGKARPVSNKKTTVPHGDETILLVEDEAVVRRNISACLQQLGYRVLEACNGRDALVVCAGVDIDLLFTDMLMPEDMSGAELTTVLRKSRPNLRVVISSGYSAELADHKKGERDGIMYLPKPYELADLANTVRCCLDTDLGSGRRGP